MTKSWEKIAREQADTLLKQLVIITRLEKKLEAIKTWVTDREEYSHFYVEELEKILEGDPQK